MDQIDFESIEQLQEELAQPPETSGGDAIAIPDDSPEQGDGGPTRPPQPGGGVAGPLEQIEGLAPLDIGPLARTKRITQQSHELMAHARQCRPTKKAVLKADGLERQVQRLSGTLNAVTALIQSAADLIGLPSAEHVRKKRSLTQKDFIVLCRAAFIPSRKQVSLDVRHTKIIAAAADLILRRPSMAMRHVLAACRAPSAMSRSSGDALLQRNFVHMTYTHLWDESKVKRSDRVSKKYKQSR